MSKTLAAGSVQAVARLKCIAAKSAPVDNRMALLRAALCTHVDNRRSARVATISHALALFGVIAGYLVTFVCLGGATG
jgi:hypothetical protein